MKAAVRRWRGHPVLAAVLLILVAADFGLVAAMWSGRSTPLGRITLGPEPKRATLMPDWGTIIDGPDGPRLYDLSESADELVRTLDAHPETLYAISRYSQDTLKGGLAPWWHTHGARFALQPFGWSADGVPSRVSDFARDLITARYMPHEDAATVILDDADRTQTRLDWPGIAHDVVMLPLAAFALVNLAFVPGYLRRRQREKRLARGECPKCRYLLAGLPPGATSCPECGESIPARGG